MKILQSRIQSLLEANAKIKDSDEDLKDKIVVEMKDLDYSDSDAEFLHRAMNIVNTHLDDSDFDQLTFASEMGVSKSTLYNKLRLLAGMNTTSFINSIRMKQAVHFLEQYPNIRVSELAYRVGYNDPKYFSTSFKKYYGILVKEYVETKIKHQ
jgi:AraC-like DNA-binding protein